MIELPKMPPGRSVTLRSGIDLSPIFLLEDMKAIALAAMMEERERCAKLCNALDEAIEYRLVGYNLGYGDGARESAEAIRNQPKPV